MQPNNPQRPSQRPQFFDVVRPGRTPASPNARPVLASNRPPVPDTSMKQGAPAVPPSVMNTPYPVIPAQSIASPQPQSMVQPQLASSPSRPMPPSPLVSRISAEQDIGQTAVENEAPMPEPLLASQHDFQAPADNHKGSIWSEVLAILAIVVLVATIIDILLDADILNLPLPHTNFFDY